MNQTARVALVPPQTRIATLHGLLASGGWRMETARSLSSHLFVWITKGQGRSTIDGVERGYCPGTGIFVPAGVMHGIELNPRVRGFAIFVPRASDITMPEVVIQVRSTDNAEQDRIRKAMECIDNEMRELAPGFERVVAAHVSLISVWLERQPDDNKESAPTRQSASQRIVREFATLVERDVDASKSVADFAAALSVTPTHLSRVCRDNFGKPASEILQDRIMLEAKQLLTTTDLKVQDVSSTLGFSSPAYFTRMFAQHMGESPSAYRNNLEQQA